MEDVKPQKTKIYILIEDIPFYFYNIKYLYIQYVFFILKHNISFILYLKLHKIRATSFGVLPSSGPSEN